MRAAALAGNGVDAFDVFRPQLVEDFVDERHAVIFADARFHVAIQLLVRGVHHRAGQREQRDFVFGLEHSRLLHHLLPVDDFDALLLQGEEDRQFDDVNGQRFVLQTAFDQFDIDFVGDGFRAPGFRGNRAAQQGWIGARTLFAVEPGAIKLMMARC